MRQRPFWSPISLRQGIRLMVCEWRKVGNSLWGIVTDRSLDWRRSRRKRIGVPAGAIVRRRFYRPLLLVCTVIKSRYQYDDSLDVFGACRRWRFRRNRSVAFRISKYGGRSMGSRWANSSVQVFAAIAAAIFTIVVTFVILKILKATIGLKVEEQDEVIGLDLSDHGESGYND